MEETTSRISFPIGDIQSPSDMMKLATLLLATIQESKDKVRETRDRVFQIEYVFLSQLYPLLHSKFESLNKCQDEWRSKEADLLLQIETLEAENKLLRLGKEKPLREKEEMICRLRDEVTSVRVRCDELEQLLDWKSKEADEVKELHTSLLNEVKLKDSVIASTERKLKESEESRNVLCAKVSDLEKRADEFWKELGEKSEQLAKGNEVKQNLFKKIESQVSEVMRIEEVLKDQEEEKKLILAKLNNTEENVSRLQEELRTKNEEVVNCGREKQILLSKMSGLEEKVNELQRDLRGRASDVAKTSSTENPQPKVESIITDLLTERKKYKDLTAAYKSLKSQHTYLRSKYGLTRENMLPQSKLETENDLLRNNQNQTTFHGPEDDVNASPDACNMKKMKNDVSSNDNLKKDKARKPIQEVTPFSPTSVVIASKCPSSVKPAPVAGRKRSVSPWIDTRSRQGQNGVDLHDDFFDTPIENARANLDRSTKEKVPEIPVSIQNDLNLGSSDDETQDMTADPPKLQKQHMPVTVAGKNGFKYVEPVRKRAERENLRGVECKQCKKFYDAVLPDGGVNDNDNNKHGFRCEHHEGVSRHRAEMHNISMGSPLTMSTPVSCVHQDFIVKPYWPRL